MHACMFFDQRKTITLFRWRFDFLLFHSEEIYRTQLCNYENMSSKYNCSAYILEVLVWKVKFKLTMRSLLLRRAAECSRQTPSVEQHRKR